MTDTAGAQCSSSWVAKSTRIRITLGEFCVANIRFRAVTLPDLDWRNPIHIADEEIQRQLQTGVEAVYLSSAPTTEHLPRLCFRKYGVRYIPWQAGRHYIDLDGTFQDYLSRLKSKARNTLTRHVRKFAEASGGTIDFREYHSADEIAVFYDLASQISVKTYQHHLLKSGLSQTEDFRRALLELAERGRLWAYIIFHNHSPVAYMYNTAHNDLLVSQTIGYDPAFRQYAPGNVLHYQVLNRVFSERRFRVFDFGTGESFHKSFFGTGVTPCAAVYYFAYTPKNLVFLGVHLGAWFVSATVVRLLSALRAKEFVKRTLRRAC
jgi:GNAT acetyltransferase-like protein